jgi:hypothetical protein
MVLKIEFNYWLSSDECGFSQNRIPGHTAASLVPAVTGHSELVGEGKVITQFA